MPKEATRDLRTPVGSGLFVKPLGAPDPDAPVGVTSSDERAHLTTFTVEFWFSDASPRWSIRQQHPDMDRRLRGKGDARIDAIDDATRQLRIWASEPWPEIQEPVPSSDEPEGEERLRSIVKDLEGWAGNPMGAPPRALLNLRDRVLALAPVPVGDAEPVAWRLEIDGLPPWFLDYDPLARGGKHAVIVTTPLYERPERSRDAGVWKARIVEQGKSLRGLLAEVDDALDAHGVRREDDNGRELGRKLRVNYALGDGAVDLVLPAEGERRDELTELIWGYLEENVPALPSDADTIYDALRAAAGKAGSDDAA